MDATCLHRPPAYSPLFSLPVGLRLLIYELVFSSEPLSFSDHAPSLCKSSTNLEPLLTCRHLYREARLIAFACTTHSLNWTRASSCLRKLRTLDPAQHTHIRHVAINTTASGLYGKLLPLRQHLDHVYAPFLSLESLTIILDVPEYESLRDKARRVQEQNMVVDSVWYFKNVERAIVMNLMHRDELRGRPGMHGEWTCMEDEPPAVAVVEDELIEETRWQFELTTFYDYGWKPWFARKAIE
ncbi:hypothetical protein CC80DRAFT_591811 [Byssothecium circinans]|uniref:Uncharacterized protein n=1 Tax=Byssothecium circinans TaxID=147558 RepID=A0A6A5U1X1_9PLEO|nr:hypothetical protein CC80DRAFT_591811 [Byssothecium circinans]